VKWLDGMLLGTENLMRAGAGCSLCGMVLVTAADVAGRAFASPLFGTEELVAFLAALTAGFSLPYAHRMQSHIAVEIFIRRYGRKVRRVIRLLVDAVCLALFSVLAWRLFDYAVSMRRSGVLSMNLELPEYLVVALVGLGVVVFALHLVCDVLRAVRGEA